MAEECRNVLWIESSFMSVPRSYFSIAKTHGEVFGGIPTESGSVEVLDGEVWRKDPKIPTYRRNAPPLVPRGLSFSRPVPRVSHRPN